MYSEAAVNQKILDAYAFSMASKDDQKRMRDQQTREGWAKRNPELNDPNYIEDMKQYLPKVTPSQHQLEQQAMREQGLSSNLNVHAERIERLNREESLLDGSR
jgi:hypothetical protein